MGWLWVVYHLLLYIIGLTTLALVKQQQAILYVDGLYHPFTIALLTSTKKNVYS